MNQQYAQDLLKVPRAKNTTVEDVHALHKAWQERKPDSGKSTAKIERVELPAKINELVKYDKDILLPRFKEVFFKGDENAYPAVYGEVKPDEGFNWFCGEEGRAGTAEGVGSSAGVGSSSSGRRPAEDAKKGKAKKRKIEESEEEEEKEQV